MNTSKESHVELCTTKVLSYIKHKRHALKDQENEVLERFIERNIKPAKKGWFWDRREVTRQDVVMSLEDIMCDDMFGKLTFRDYLTEDFPVKFKKLHLLESMCNDSASGRILLCASDYNFLKRG